MWHELEEAGVIEDGRRLVSPEKSERSRKAVELLNKRRAGAGANSGTSDAPSENTKNKGPQGKDPHSKPEASRVSSGNDGHKQGEEHRQDQDGKAKSKE